jgi:hydrogenase maturation protease
MGKRYLIGLGNYAKDDDGVGLRIIEQVLDQNLDDGFEAIEAGNNGLSILTYFADDTERIVLVDCALMGKEPGEWLIFGPEDVATQKTTANISTHEGDILKLIELAKSLDYPLPEIRIMAIEPESLGMEMTLSATLAKRFDEYVAAVVAEAKRG